MQIYVHTDYTYVEQKRRMTKIGRMDIQEERIPPFDTQIGQVRFNTTMSEELAETLAQLNDPDNGNMPTSVDPEELAQQLVWDLRWHVSEG